MANSAYWRNCIREIRQSVYGRDNRKPIADSIQCIDTFHRKIVREYAQDAIKHCNDMTPTLDAMDDKIERSLGSVFTEPLKTWYTYDYRDVEVYQSDMGEDAVDVITTQMRAESIGKNDYMLIDSVNGDTVDLVPTQKRVWSVPNPVKEEHIHYGDDYILVINRINES